MLSVESNSASQLNGVTAMILTLAKVVYIRLSQVGKACVLAIHAQMYLPKDKKFGLMVWGQSGIGKNGVTDRLAERLSKATGKTWNMKDINVSAMTPEDLVGLPRITKDGMTEDCPRFRLDPNSYGICRFDETDRPSYFQNLIAMAKWAIDRTVENPLPVNWFVLGLANGCSDSHTEEFTEHLKGRFVHVYISANSDLARKERLDYLESVNALPAIKRFASMNPIATRDEFEEHAVDNDRSRTGTNAILMAYENLKKNGLDTSDVLLPVLAGTIGKNSAVELLKIYELSDLPTLNEVIASPLTVVIPEDLSLRHKYVTTLVHETQSDCSKACALLPYLVRLPDEVARYSIEILATACSDVCKTTVYITWKNRTR